VAFELWDGELGLSLGTFESEDEALMAVARLCQDSRGSPAPLGLISNGTHVVASGEALVERAQSATRVSRV
jgi:hypothetical protein